MCVCVCVCVQVKEFVSRFHTIPDMLELDHLTVSGDVTFGKNVCLKASTFSHTGGRRRGRAWQVRYSGVHCGLSLLLSNCREQSSSLPTTVIALTYPQVQCWKTKSFLGTYVFWITKQ